jgi:glycosyltransferase involved in cell wall biosynthesis
MNCYNSEKYLKQAIDSVFNQSYNNWELIIWDNQSTDGTALIASFYSDNRVKYFLAEKYSPLGEARNMAIQNSNGEIIAFLDSDDLWLPKKLEKQVILFNNEKVGIVICDTIFFNQKGKHKQLYRKKKPLKGMVFRELLSNYFISLETAMISRRALDSLDYWFDTRFEVIEEYDLFVRLGFYWELAYVDEVLAKWRVHSSSWTWSKSELFPLEKRIMLKNLSNNIPNFSEKYKIEVKHVEQSIAIEEAHHYWQNGNKDKARKILKPNINGDIRLILFFLLTFLPYGFYKLLQQFKGVIRPI